MYQILCSLYSTLVFIPFLIGCSAPEQKKGGQTAFVENIVFPLQKQHVHGPTIVELPNGDLLSAWFQGSGERWADDVRIMGARMEKGDTTWSESFLMADTPGFPDINPVLFLDVKNQLWLVWYPVIANQWETSIPKFRISNRYNDPGPPTWYWQDIIIAKPGDKTERGIQPSDRFVLSVEKQLDGYEVYLEEELMQQMPAEQHAALRRQWLRYRQKLDSLSGGRNMVRSGRLLTNGKEEPASLGYPLTRRIGWQTKNKPVLINDQIVLPLYSDGFDCSLFAITKDFGETWEFSNPVIGGIGIQPTIAVASDGSLHAYLRDNGPAPKRMQKTSSQDGGYTWTIAKDIGIPNPGAGFDIVTLRSGEWMMVYNETENGRHDLTVAISVDDGKSWSLKKKIEYDDRGKEATACHYPAIIQGADDIVHIVYSYHHNDRHGEPHKTIKYVSFPLSWMNES